MASSNITRDHEEIRRWAEERGATPSHVVRTGSKEDIGILRLDFPGYSGADSLEPISWDQFFEKFDERNLALVYQEATAEGQKSNFNKIISGETAEAAEQEASKKRTGRGARKSASGGGSSRSGGKKSASASRSAASRSSSKTAGARKSSAAPAKKTAAASKAGAGTKKTTSSKTAGRAGRSTSPSKKTSGRSAPKRSGSSGSGSPRKAAGKKSTAKKSGPR